MRRRDQRHRCPAPSVRDEHGGALRWFVGLVLVLALAAAGAATAVWQGWVPEPDLWSSSGADGANGSDGGQQPQAEPPASGPGLSIPAAPEPPSVLDAAETTGHVKPAELASLVGRLVDDPALGKRYALMVEQLGDRKPLLAEGGKAALVTPASTLKLLTTSTALHLLGPDHRFATTVVSGPTRRSVVLVGGGDPLLTGATPSRVDAATTYPKQASLQDLARRTAGALKHEGVRRVRLAYDVSLYSGPAISPAWQPTYVPDDVVSPIVPLWVDEGRAKDGYADRVADPAATAAADFAQFLDRAGVKVTGKPVQRRAPSGAQELASVESAPLAQIVQHVLEQSDNEGAETLLRQAAIAAGRPGSFEAGVATVRQELSGLGIDLRDAVLHDGSGLSRHDRVPVRALVEVLQLAASADHPELRPVVSTLPVAGFTGSLVYRFVEDAPSGLGVVRAKTGTLSEAGVHSLAGIVMTRGGTPLVFAEVADPVRFSRTLDARDQLDKIAARLATCTC